MKAKLIWITPEAEKIIAYCARVSSENQENPEYARLLKYCINHEHWSVFEQSCMCLEIETSRAISAQIIRHKSFSFQEFSQRYAFVQEFEEIMPRRQAPKNRQSSVDNLDNETQRWFYCCEMEIRKLAIKTYDEALQKGVARECARSLLPMSIQTKMYMTGNIRSWIHYIQLRTKEDTQKEHRDIAEVCKRIFIEQLPVISAALGWKDD